MLIFLFYCFIFFLSILFFVCSFQFAHQKWGTLIAGYNKLTEKQKQLVDFKTISKIASRCAFAGGIYMIVIAIFLYLILNAATKSSLAIVLFAVPSLLFFIYLISAVLKSEKYYKIEE